MFLLQTVNRQTREQRQWSSDSGRQAASRKATASLKDESVTADIPDHDLDPPKFCRRALNFLLEDWNAVKALIMTGGKPKENPDDNAEEESSFMKFQGKLSFVGCSKSSIS